MVDFSSRISPFTSTVIFLDAFPIFLVVILRRIPLRQRLDRGDDRLPPIRLCSLDTRASRRFLLRRVWEDRGTILRADIVALAVELRRIVSGEEDVEYLLIAYRVRIEGETDGLGMAGAAAADLLVSRVRNRPADIAALDFRHSDHVGEHRLGAPEAPTRQSRLLFAHVTSRVLRYPSLR